MSRRRDAYRYTETRLRLGELLARFEAHLDGRVLDLGGHRGHVRGVFRPRDDSGWIYLNLDAAREPDVVALGESIPFRNGSFDAVLCTQVLEHVQDERAVVGEIARILRPGGRLLLSVPFLFPIHAHPEDNRRFTDQGLRRLLKDFELLELRAMGGPWSVVGDFVKMAGKSLPRGLRRIAGEIACYGIAPRARREMARLNQGDPLLPRYTPGYFVVARKPDRGVPA